MVNRTKKTSSPRGRKRARLDSNRMIAAFRRALTEIKSGNAPRNSWGNVRISRRSIAKRAHELYCQEIIDGEKAPSYHSFEKCVIQSRGTPGVLELFNINFIPARKYCKLDHGRFKRAFQEAIDQTGFEMGSVTSEEISRRVHSIYCQELLDRQQPSMSNIKLLVRKRYKSHYSGKRSIERVREYTAGNRAGFEIPELPIAKEKIHYLVSRERMDVALSGLLTELCHRVEKLKELPRRFGFYTIGRLAHSAYCQMFGGISRQLPSVRSFVGLAKKRSDDPRIQWLFTQPQKKGRLLVLRLKT